jgi:hypothetical protein
VNALTPQEGDSTDAPAVTLIPGLAGWVLFSTTTQVLNFIVIAVVEWLARSRSQKRSEALRETSFVSAIMNQ